MVRWEIYGIAEDKETDGLKHEDEVIVIVGGKNGEDRMEARQRKRGREVIAQRLVREAATMPPS